MVQTNSEGITTHVSSEEQELFKVVAQNTTPPPKPTLEPGSESVNGTNAGRKSLPEDKGPDQSPYTANSAAKVIIPNKKLYPGYNPFAPIDKKKLKELTDWLKTFIIEHLSIKNHIQVKHGDDLPISRLYIDAWINVLRKRYDANPQHFRSERMCFLDHLFAQQWRFNYKDFKDSEPDQNGLGRRLPRGAWNYYAGTIPSFCQSNKVWGTNIDDGYAPVNYNDTHWISMWISIPKRHIVVWDSICSSISPEELDVVIEHFLYMVPYLLVECASSDEQRAQYSLEPFTYERPTNIPPARAGDCGVYTLKYIECHALGIEFSKKDFAKANGKTMRDKMAVDIFQELPDAHEFENKDNDANLDALYKDCYVGEIPSPSSKLLRRSDGAISPAKRTFICSFQAIEEARTIMMILCYKYTTFTDSGEKSSKVSYVYGGEMRHQDLGFASSDVKTNVAVFKTLLDIEVKGGINVIKQGTLKQVGFREQVEDFSTITADK
ncbi:hypothetical protein F2Q68_00022169 [Brassica cretica]|uniref:Ubiquitin-like protease family profile domain-containing protein n=1 Tax=Brassica cretica TaxID=69181 RepID=A0A8S9FSP3_BRACR|nr:hypothetical protein F2Q68_00022169 [Brassica cretica]